MKSKVVACLVAVSLFLPSCTSDPTANLGGAADAGVKTVVEVFAGKAILTILEASRTSNGDIEARFTVDRTSFEAKPGSTTFKGGAVDFSSPEIEGYFTDHLVRGVALITREDNPIRASDGGVDVAAKSSGVALATQSVYEMEIIATCPEGTAAYAEPPSEYYGTAEYEGLSEGAQDWLAEETGPKLIKRTLYKEDTGFVLAMPPGLASFKSKFILGGGASEIYGEADFASFGDQIIRFDEWKGTPHKDMVDLTGQTVEIIYKDIVITSRDIVNQVFEFTFTGEVVVME